MDIKSFITPKEHSIFIDYIIIFTKIEPFFIIVYLHIHIWKARINLQFKLCS
jgi:hypothetical protein